MDARLEQATWHVRALHLHFPSWVARPVQKLALRVASRSATALAILYYTDKGPHGHGYTDHYTRFFGPRRKEPLTVLEIGIHEGSSLRLWRRFFPRATIVGLDLEPPEQEMPGVEMVAGDQSDPECLAGLITRYGPFDIVIDDGSHVGSHIRASFEALFPALSSGGWYVIEDLETSYLSRVPYDGGPVGTPGTAVDLVKSLVDHTQSGVRSPDVSEIHVFDEIAFIRKA